MSPKYRIISIGALSRHPLWNESAPKRLSHATTTLIRGSTTILVDPSVPPEILTHRLDEQAGLTPDQIDVVFLTSFRPVHRRSLTRFERATWLVHEAEIEAMVRHLDDITEGGPENSSDVMELVRQERALLDRCQPADEKLTPQVHLYPAPGVTPGAAGLLLALPTRTVVVAGDAVITKDHFEVGRIYEQAADVERAKESFDDIAGIADEIVPGHDNLFAVSGR